MESKLVLPQTAALPAKIHNVKLQMLLVSQQMGAIWHTHYMLSVSQQMPAIWPTFTCSKINSTRISYVTNVKPVRIPQTYFQMDPNILNPKSMSCFCFHKLVAVSVSKGHCKSTISTGTMQQVDPTIQTTWTKTQEVHSLGLHM